MPKITAALEFPWETIALRDLLERVRRPVQVEPNETYREIGIRSHGKGIF
jgi:type I restriction enzyme S subunit